MEISERIKDINSLGQFNSEEVENTDDQNTFQSWEFWQILHYTNEEWYYIADDGIESIADEEHHTEKGIVFCFA